MGAVSVDDSVIGIGTQAVADHAGISYRQLDYWTRGGAVTPSIDPSSGTGTARRWSFEDADCVAVIADVMRDFDALHDYPSAMSLALVRRLWAAWHDGTSVLDVGRLSIRLR